jgi:hypothetical protein
LCLKVMPDFWVTSVKCTGPFCGTAAAAAISAAVTNDDDLSFTVPPSVVSPIAGAHEKAAAGMIASPTDRPFSKGHYTSYYLLTGVRFARVRVRRWWW